MLTTTTRRRFTFVGSGSNKFWEIDPPYNVNGQWVVDVTFGRIGTGGQDHSNVFHSQGAAYQHYSKKVNEKLYKGYKEAGTAKVKNNVVTYNPTYIPVAKPKPCSHDDLKRNGAKWKCSACGKQVEFEKSAAPVSEIEIEVVAKVRRFFNLSGRQDAE